jgi:hypothetical protein
MGGKDLIDNMPSSSSACKNSLYSIDNAEKWFMNGG